MRVKGCRVIAISQGVQRQYTGSILVLSACVLPVKYLCTACILPINPKLCALLVPMAQSLPDPSARKLKGKIGNFVYYELNGKSCVRSVPHRVAPPTSAEKENQSRFRAASKFAHSTLTDPEQNARYAEAASRAGSTAYNVAVSDFMHPPVITEVDLTGYTGKAGESIRICAEEKKIGAAAVNLVIVDGAKAVLEEGAATAENDGVTWRYTAQRELPSGQSLWITTTARDQPGNRTSKTLRHVTG